MGKVLETLSFWVNIEEGFEILFELQRAAQTSDMVIIVTVAVG